MNKYYIETGIDNLIKSIEFNIGVLLKCFVESLRMRHDCTMNRCVYLQTCLVIRNNLLSLHMC